MREKNNDTGFRHLLFILFMNKYTITSLIFLVWLTFFDRNNLVEKMQLRSKIATLFAPSKRRKSRFPRHSSRTARRFS